MEAVITIPIDPVLHLGPIPVHWYGVGYAVAFIVGIRLVDPFFASHGFSEKARTDIFWWNIGVGLTCARLFFVVQQPDLGSYLHPPWRIIAVWEGGMAFFGAFMGCAATCVWLAWRLRLPVWVIFDGGAIFATLPQAIGRIGNIINGDILGPASNLPWATRYTNPESFPQMLHRSDTAYQPAAAYELLVSLVLFAIVIWLVRHRPAGTAAIAYACGYPLSQLLLFFLREDRKSTRLNSSHANISYAVFCLKKKKK